MNVRLTGLPGYDRKPGVSHGSSQSQCADYRHFSHFSSARDNRPDCPFCEDRLHHAVSVLDRDRGLRAVGDRLPSERHVTARNGLSTLLKVNWLKVGLAERNAG